MGMSPRLLRPRASGFDPRSIAGLAAWWDASDAATVTLNSTTVSEWRDKSGNSRHLTQTTAARQPTYQTNSQNGRATIQFTNANTQFMAYGQGMFSYSGAGTVFVVTKTFSRSTSDFGSFLSEGTGTTVRTFVAVAPGVFNVAGTLPATDIYGPHGQRASSTITATNATVLQWKWDNWSTHRGNAGTLIGVNNDGVTTQSYGTLDPTDFTGNTRQFFVGQTGDQTALTSSATLNATICEIVAYTAALNQSQRSAVRRYLGAKWGITVT